MHNATKTVMISNLTSAILLVAIGTPALALVTFFPALLELRQPRDRGPRVIMNDFRSSAFHSLNSGVVMRIDEEREFDQSILLRLTAVLQVLPRLEV